MANNNKDYNISNDKKYRRNLGIINSMISQANLSLYGTDKNDDDISNLDNKFHEIVSTQMSSFDHDNDITSFLGKLVSNDSKRSALNDMLDNQFLQLGTGDDYSTVQTFVYDAYRNRLLEQSDLHEVASQLIELSEAILITRDAIISADIVQGRMSRTLKFDNMGEEDNATNIKTVEKVEQKFDLLNKIKNFIIPNTLEYGEYYAYIIPYAKLFDQFMRSKEQNVNGMYSSPYKESTLMESFNEDSVKSTKRHFFGKKEKPVDDEDDFNYFCEKTYEEYNKQNSTKYEKNKNISEESKEDIPFDAFKSDLKNMLENVTVSNDPVPLPVMEEGFNSVEYLKNYMESSVTEDSKEAPKAENLFKQVQSHFSNNQNSSEGLFSTSNKKHKNEFKDIEDCYVKMIEPTKIIPIKIMNKVIGYYYIQDEDITPLSGAISNTLYYSKFDEHRREATVIDAIADRVVKSFDKKFLKDNIKFKETIVECIEFYNLNEKRLKFQFIPAEYIQEFKIDEDVNGNGQSMIKKSLFYAKLYLMLLLFKIMTIITNSNDQKVNYIKVSGIDKNLSNKVQEIARIKQSRQINLTDLFSYTTLINKVGNGTEAYIPVGRSGERPIETEILSGQDVQMNSDLMEMLKNSYILGTGVPAAIVNYLNEADFAKQVEQNNTKFNGRVVNYQLDFNSAITEMYKKILRSSSNLDDTAIDNFEFILQPPKSVMLSTTSEMIGQFQAESDFLTQLFFEDPSQTMDPNVQKNIREFRKLLAKEELPSLNIDEKENLIKQAIMNVKADSKKPNPANGDNGDDDGFLDDDELGMDPDTTQMMAQQPVQSAEPISNGGPIVNEEPPQTNPETGEQETEVNPTPLVTTNTNEPQNENPEENTNNTNGNEETSNS